MNKILSGKKAAFHTLGCKVNTYETDAMEQMLVSEGCEIVDFESTADFYIVNTCSVTNMADRKSRQMLHRAKKKNPEGIVVAAGCYVQAVSKEVLQETGVDVIIGNNQKKELVEILSRYILEHDAGAAHDIGTDKEYENLELYKVTEHTRAYIKVQDGCNQFCSYCIIPYTRGRVRSRGLDDVINEVTRLTKTGINEVVLTGIHLSSYGVDFKDGTNLLMLIKAVHDIDGVRRIRLGSLEPRIVTEDFAESISALPKICPHFHLSLQSGCDATLKRMNRRYTAAEFMEGCRLLRKYFANPALTTDVIVGFPGETEEEFDECRSFLESVKFFELHVFKYSRRKNTAADRMENQVPEHIKTQRSNILLEMDRELSKEYRKYWIGKNVEVLTEEAAVLDGKPVVTGYTKEYVKVALPQKIGANQIVSGKIDGFFSEEVLKME